MDGIDVGILKLGIVGSDAGRGGNDTFGIVGIVGKVVGIVGSVGKGVTVGNGGKAVGCGALALWVMEAIATEL